MQCPLMGGSHDPTHPPSELSDTMYMNLLMNTVPPPPIPAMTDEGQGGRGVELPWKEAELPSAFPFMK